MSNIPDRSPYRQAYFEKHNITLPGFLKQEDEAPRKSGSVSVSSGLEAYTGEWDADALRHLMRRTLFGIQKDHFDTLSRYTRQEAVDALLTLGTIPDAPVNAYNRPEESFIDPDIPWGETFADAEWNGDFEGDRVNSVKAWWVRNIINQEPTIAEKMLFFWHNHIPIAQFDVFWGSAVYKNVEMLRRNALGNFKTMMRDVTLDAGMLMFLNGTLNSKEAPDENYSRELQELFCIGKGPEAQYTEQDVQSAAKVLTGWKVAWPEARGSFFWWDHDTSDKEFSSFYGNRIIQGRDGENGADELDDLLDMIFENNEVALFIARKIYRFFVYYDITEETEQNMIQPMAQLFRDSNYEIYPVLQALFNSEHFYDMQLRGACIKTPLDFTLGYFRSLGMRLEQNDIARRYQEGLGTVYVMSSGGLFVGEPPSVSGYPAWYQEPNFDKYWITTHTIKERGLRTDSMVYWGLWNLYEPIAADLVAYAASKEHSDNAELLVQEICEELYGVLPGEVQLAEFTRRLISNDMNPGYWTAAWRDYINDQGNDQKRSIVENRLKWTIQAILQLPESHLY